jgi:hypothetical protein
MAPHGTSKQYLVERLRRENQTALLAAVEAGKITALSAAVSLGWVRRPPRMGGSTHRAKRIQHQLRAITGEGLDAGRMMELWLGPNPSAGSLFGSREELETAWREHRSELMARWGSHARRPAAFYEFEWDGPRPAYAVERSVLWRAPGVLSADERIEVETEWRRDFDATKGMSASERREHLDYHDVPSELIAVWEAERKAAPRRRRGRSTATSTAASEEAAATK